MAADLEHPERVVGFHFFNPVAVMPLLEIVRAEKTDDATLATAFAVAKPLKKGPILVKDATGFVMNRLLLRFMGEVHGGHRRGHPGRRRRPLRLVPLGLPMTPMMLTQLTGPAVGLHVQETLHDAFGDRFPVSENLRRIVESGEKILVGWDEQGQQIVAPGDRGAAAPGRPARRPASRCCERALLALAQEARLMLDEGVVADAADIDLAMITGAGWPFWLGGITPYLDRSGVSERATGRRFAPPGVATLPA